MPTPAPGWYQHSNDEAGLVRYWDGSAWVGPATDPAMVDPAQMVSLSTDDTIVTLGGWFDRGLARFFDSLILGIFWVGLDLGLPDGSLGNAALVLLVGVVFAYEIGFVALKGWTPGKKMLDLTVVNSAHIAPPGWRAATLRSLPMALSLVPVVGTAVGLLIGAACGVLIATTIGNRSVYDFAGNTHVIRTFSSRAADTARG